MSRLIAIFFIAAYVASIAATGHVFTFQVSVRHADVAGKDMSHAQHFFHSPGLHNHTKHSGCLANLRGPIINIVTQVLSTTSPFVPLNAQFTVDIPVSYMQEQLYTHCRIHCSSPHLLAIWQPPRLS